MAWRWPCGLPSLRAGRLPCSPFGSPQSGQPLAGRGAHGPLCRHSCGGLACGPPGSPSWLRLCAVFVLNKPWGLESGSPEGLGWGLFGPEPQTARVLVQSGTVGLEVRRLLARASAACGRLPFRVPPPACLRPGVVGSAQPTCPLPILAVQNASGQPAGGSAAVGLSLRPGAWKALWAGWWPARGQPLPV